MTLLSVAILSLALMPGPQASNQRAEAERLTQAGSYAQALKLYQALAAANPDEIETRMAIARLHERMGEEERAVDVYRSIVATQPGHVDALLGLGRTLTTLGRLHDASEILNRAEAAAADRPAVLAEQGRLHTRAGHYELALAYYRRALAIEPGNEAAQVEYRALKAQRAHRISGTYYFEDFNDSTPNTHSGYVEVNARVNDGFRLSGGGEHLRKFDREEDRGGGGLEWKPRHDLELVAKGLFASGAVVLPRADVSFAVQHSHRNVEWLGAYRYLDFDDSSSWILAPGVTARLDDQSALTLWYYHSRSDLDTSADTEDHDGFSAAFARRMGRTLSVDVRYLYGFEGLENIASDRLSQTSTNSLAGGFDYTFRLMTSFGARYEHQFRDAGVHVSTIFATFTQRF
jgi:tetratricopeptide (TPR) repeat protein